MPPMDAKPVRRYPLGNISLHDTAIEALQVSLVDRRSVVRVRGVSGDLPREVRADITCHGLDSQFLLLDSHELSVNARSGNVQDGHFECLGEAGVFRLHLTGGMLECTARQLASIIHEAAPPALAGASACSVWTDFDTGPDDLLFFAVLTGFTYDVARRRFWTQLLLWEEASQQRVPAWVCFKGVRSFTVRLDASTLQVEGRAGNVSHCLMDKQRGICRFYLCNGIIQISAESAVIAGA